VKEVKMPLLPEANDEWASDMGFDSLDEFKEELSKQISRIKEGAARDAMRAQIRDQLAETVEMDLPEDLIKHVLEENTQRHRMLLKSQGMDEEEIEKKMAELAEQSAEDTAKNVKLYFIFDAIAKAETILVTEEELRARSDQLATSYGVDAERFWEMMDSENRIDALSKDIRDDKTFDLLISKATVEEAEPDTDHEATEEGKTHE